MANEPGAGERPAASVLTIPSLPRINLNSLRPEEPIIGQIVIGHKILTRATRLLDKNRAVITDDPTEPMALLIDTIGKAGISEATIDLGSGEKRQFLIHVLRVFLDAAKEADYLETYCKDPAELTVDRLIDYLVGVRTASASLGYDLRIGDSSKCGDSGKLGIYFDDRNIYADETTSVSRSVAKPETTTPEAAFLNQIRNKLINNEGRLAVAIKGHDPQQATAFFRERAFLKIIYSGIQLGVFPAPQTTSEV